MPATWIFGGAATGAAVAEAVVGGVGTTGGSCKSITPSLTFDPSSVVSAM
jgi:hypothetical protein